MISGYERGDDVGVRNLAAVLAARATMTGFTIYDHMERFPAFVTTMAGLLRRGDVVFVHDILDGIEQVAEGFVGLLRGDAIGKRLVRRSAPTRSADQQNNPRAGNGPSAMVPTTTSSVR